MKASPPPGGRGAAGGELLAQALAVDPRDDRAWLWLSGVVSSDAERRYCLEQVLALDPAHAAARRGLAQLPADTVPCPPRRFAEAECATVPGVAVSLAATGTTTRLVPPASFRAPITVSDPAVAMDAPPPIVATTATAAAPAAPAAPPELIELVVRALGSGRNPEETCRMLCQQHGYPWESARQLVAAIAVQHGLRIARRQAPFLLFLGIATLVGGLGLLGLGLLRLRAAGQLHYSPLYYRNMLMALISGALMVLGAIIGLRQVLGSLRK